MSQSKCEALHETIALFVTGELGPQEAAELLRHLGSCDECLGLYKQIVAEEELLRDTFGEISQIARQRSLEGRVGGMSVHGTGARSADAPLRVAHGRRSRRNLTIFAATAATVVLGAIGLFNRTRLASVSSGATLADVMQKAHKARTVTYTRVVQVPGQDPMVSKEMAMDPGHLRSVFPDGYTITHDFARGRMVEIDPRGSAVRVTHLVQHEKERFPRYLDWIETLHETDGKFLGQKDLDGRMVNVFAVNRLFEHATVWADPQTDLPVRVVRVVSPSPDKGIKIPTLTLFLSDFLDGHAPAPESGGAVRPASAARISLSGPGVRRDEVTATLTDFVWNAPLDESSFAEVFPDGYRVSEVDYGDPPVDEHALIESLRFWAEVSDGVFPDDPDVFLDARPKLIQKYNRGGPAEQEFAEALKMGYVVVHGLYFVQTLRAVDNWYYAGQGVRLGASDRPICWWKNKDSWTYSVIYADLSLRNVAAAELPVAGRR